MLAVCRRWLTEAFAQEKHWKTGKQRALCNRTVITWVLTICIFIVVYERMIEIYMVTSVAPIPMASMMNREWGQMGQNYLRSLFALGFQAFLIMVCVAIYATLVQNIAITDDVSTAVWTCIGYTVLLCFTLFKTSSLAKSVFNAH